jgi:energy-coupling factor transporter ATP-binding protein EcfA2
MRYTPAVTEGQLLPRSAPTRASYVAVLAMPGISELADRARFQLSGGEKKRLAIASVLMMDT